MQFASSFSSNLDGNVCTHSPKHLADRFMSNLVLQYVSGIELKDVVFGLQCNVY